MNQGQILKIIDRIKKSSFAKNVTIIAGGAASVQIIQMLLSPILTRLYSPEEFGVLTVYNSILAVLIVIGPLNYHKAIPIADDNKKATSVLALSLLILLCVTGLITIVILFGGYGILNLLNAEALFKYRYIIPIGFLFMGLYNVFIHWSYRGKKYKLITQTRLVQVIIGNGLKIGLGFLKIGSIGLISGNILNNSAGVLSLAKDYFKNNKLSFNIDELKWVAKRYIKFPLYNTMGEFIYTIGNEIPVFYITSLYGSEVIGYFGLAYTIIRIPVILIGNSIGQVFYSEMAHIGKGKPAEIKSKALKILLPLSSLGLLLPAVIILFGPALFSFVFGSEWYEAGIYAQILSPLVYVSLVVMPLGRLLEIFEKQNIGMVLHIIRVVILVLGFVLAQILSLNSYWAIGIYVTAATVVIVVRMFILFGIINHEIKNSKEKKTDSE